MLVYLALKDQKTTLPAAYCIEIPCKLRGQKRVCSELWKRRGGGDSGADDFIGPDEMPATRAGATKAMLATRVGATKAMLATRVGAGKTTTDGVIASGVPG